MKKYIVPDVEFVSFSNQEIITTSCPTYECPSMYGDSCSSKTYCPSHTDSDCPDDTY